MYSPLLLVGRVVFFLLACSPCAPKPACNPIWQHGHWKRGFRGIQEDSRVVQVFLSLIGRMVKVRRRIDVAVSSSSNPEVSRSLRRKKENENEKEDEHEGDEASVLRVHSNR